MEFVCEGSGVLEPQPSERVSEGSGVLEPQPSEHVSEGSGVLDKAYGDGVVFLNLPSGAGQSRDGGGSLLFRRFLAI
ncbi:MAG: hypothetical protein LBN21_02295 [Treponema sp.]|nr:hypothetical protein [Treponema sp.]